MYEIKEFYCMSNLSENETVMILFVNNRKRALLCECYVSCQWNQLGILYDA